MFQYTKLNKKVVSKNALVEKKWKLNTKYKWVMRGIVFYYNFKCLPLWVCLRKINFNLTLFHSICYATLFLREKASWKFALCFSSMCFSAYLPICFFMCYYSNMNWLEHLCIFVANMTSYMTSFWDVPLIP